MSRFQQQLDGWRARVDVAVVGGAVRVDGTLVWHGVSQATGDHAGDRVSPESRFPIYSITKTLTAVCVLRLDGAGLLDVDDPVVKWLPDLCLPDTVTLAHLLRHTAGVPDYGPLPEYRHAVRARPESPWTNEQFLEKTLVRGVLFEPGAGWSYSNIGYLLLRLVIERAAGMSYRRAVEEHVAMPLGLTNTFVAETIADWASCVPGYGHEVRLDAQVIDVRATYHPGWCAPGVAVSTVDDVTRFYDSLFAGALLEARPLARMLELTRVPGDHPPAVTPSYGMGIMADPDGPLGPMYGHGGGGPGYTLFAAVMPRSARGRLSVAVFCNNSFGADAARGVEELCRVATLLE